MSKSVLKFVLLTASTMPISCADLAPPNPPAAPPNQADYESLVACGASDCDASAQRIEGGTPFAMYNMACVLQALRDRTPGIYGAYLNHTWSNGAETADYTLLVRPSGDVLVGVHRWTQIEEQVDSWDPVRKCTLVTADVLDACLTEVQKGQGPDATEMAWECVFPAANVSTLNVPWFVSCEDIAPTCQ